MLAGRRRQVNTTTGTLTTSTVSTAPSMHPDTTRRSNSSARTALWNPTKRIKFSTEVEPPSLYPSLDFKRFFQSQEAAALSDTSQTKLPQPVHSPKPDTRKPPNSYQANQCVSSERTTAKAMTEKSTGTYTVRQQAQVPQRGISTNKSQPIVEPPMTSLDFNISKELFEAARKQPKDSPGSFWSHTMYKSTNPDGTTQNVKVHYCTSKHTMEHVCRNYFLNEPVLGFDLEWVAYAKREGGPRENVSLIQIASPGRIGLFHVAMFPKNDFVAPTFRQIMEDPSVEKVGVHIQADCTRLRNFLGVKTRGIFELSHLYKLLKHAEDKQRRKLINKVPVALATQVHELLKLPLYKDQSVRSSNWSTSLTSKQLTYSAADAYAGLQLYHVLEERRLAMDPRPDRPRHAELGLPIPIPPTPAVSDVESDLGSDIESVQDSGSDEFSDGSIEEVMQELVEAEVANQAAARDLIIAAGETKVAQRRASRPGGRLSVSPSALRTFYIWQANADLTPADVARLLRDPPLQTGTVIGYILDAIRAEKLTFPKDRLQREVLSLLNPTLASGKYRSIVKQCGQP
ncbi:hypothetical protein PWT90_04102 [Aphanocladium album]|nr:hypothetical protein PWT90_04102 [Aphanocladium album]